MLLITGIMGRSGTYLLKELASDGSNSIYNKFGRIRVIVRSSEDTRVLNECGLNIEIFIGDLRNEEFLKMALEGVSTLLHIAGISFSLDIVRIASKKNIKRVILVHTTGIFSKYKAAGEYYRNIEKCVYNVSKVYGMDLTILRPTMIYGSVNDRNVIVFVKMIDKLMVVPVVDHAKYKLQPVHVSDLGKAYHQVLLNSDKTANKEYILSGRNPIMLSDMFKIIEKKLGVKRKYLSFPFFIAYSGAWVVYLMTFCKTDYREKVQRLCEHRVFPHDEAARDFGYNPISFEEGIMPEVEEWKRTI